MNVDAFICSYPKSGRTWLRFALANLLDDCFQLEQNLNLANQFALLPNDDNSRSQPWKEVSCFAFTGRVPLIAASHATWDQRFENKPIVFLLRDPADVVVSRYRHLRFHQERFAGTLEEFLDNEQWGIQSLVAYFSSWEPHLDSPSVLLVTYEQLRKDTQNYFALIAKHLGISATTQQLNIALEKSTLQRMRELEEKFGVGEPNDYDRFDYRARRVGKAKIGAGRIELGPDGQEKLISALKSDQAAWRIVSQHYCLG